MLGVLISENSRGAQIVQSLGVFNKTIIPLAFVEYMR